MSKKQKLRDDLEMMANYSQALEIELKLANDEIDQLTDIINSYVKHIKMLDKQLEQQDKAIERKDMQFEGLKACYKDDLINARL